MQNWAISLDGFSEKSGAELGQDSLQNLLAPADGWALPLPGIRTAGAGLPSMPSTSRLLWITDGPGAPSERELFAHLQQFTVQHAASVYEALSLLESSRFDILFASFPLPEWTPAELLEEIQRINAFLPVIVRDPGGTLADAVRLTKLGAYQFVGAKLDAEELANHLESAVEHRHSRELALFGAAVSNEPWRRFLVGDSRAMQNVCHLVRLVGNRRCTVLITGETGTGKEMAARAIHMASSRAYLPMVSVNCTALPENLLEAELFGHVKGAFTGAVGQRIGRFEQANGSTLFLDEVGDMPLELQAKLLRVLQEREFQRLGSSETVRVDVRVIAASNCDLLGRVRQGRFREDLYYRLNVVPLVMPPLRERWSDVPPLVHHFIDKICRLEELPPKRISRETLERLSSYGWPGNVRQLENAVEMAVALSGERDTLFPGDFPLPSATNWRSQTTTERPLSIAVPDDGLDFERTVNSIEKSILEQALRKTNGNKKLAADMLRLKRTTLAAKLRSLETEPFS
jgi:DNA-binding NtrC family response regulator